jgi:hypothetical protein
MAEACIGLALMTFAWIIISYSLFMANNQIRTAMATRYAAWYQGANGSGTLATTNQIDQYFFFQPGFSIVTSEPSEPLPVIPSSLSRLFDLTDGSAANGPFKVSVSFGVPNLDSANAFPFDLMNTQVPFMANSAMTNLLSVQSTCQWDGVADTWNTPSQVYAVVWNELKNCGSLVTSILSKIF